MPTARPLRVVFIGHVDHGKSTLIARLATSGAPHANLLRSMGHAALEARPEMAHLVDQLAEERAKGMTVDTTEIQVRFDGKLVALIDAPGHLELLRNMVSGAARADMAVLVVDGNTGPTAGTLRHLRVAELLGCEAIVVAVNKLDAALNARKAWDASQRALRAAMAGGPYADAPFVPISALNGDGVLAFSKPLADLGGAPLVPTLMDIGNRLRRAPQALRLPIQRVETRADGTWIFGTVVAGTVQVGQSVRLAPSGQRLVIERLVNYPHDIDTAATGDQVCAKVSAEAQEVRRGEIIVAPESPPRPAVNLAARIVWLGSEPLEASMSLTVRCATQEAAARIVSINSDVAPTESSLRFGETGLVCLELDRSLAVETATAHPEGLWRLAFEHEGRIVSGGIVA